MKEQELLEALREMPVIDTHEHLENEDRHEKWNVLSDYTQHYFVCDLISSGLDPATIPWLARKDVPIMDKWAKLEKHWEYCRHTGYGQALDIAAKQLYGVEKICRETIQEVERGFETLHGRRGFSRHLLREMCGIEYVMDNIWRLDGDPVSGLFRFVDQFDDWVMLDAVDGRAPGQERYATLEDWTQAMLQTLEEDFSCRGACALKCALAYRRPIEFASGVSLASARAGYALCAAGHPQENPTLVRATQDYLMHRVLEWADARGCILQIHTGYQEGNANILENANPRGLNELFFRYTNIRFDLFHMGYPYQHILGAFGKMFANVRLNMCWTHMLSPVAATRALYEWLNAVPVNKIFAFGGDCRFFDGVVGHLELARRGVARVLSRCVADGLFGASTALEVGRMLFYDNPRAFYAL